MVGSSTSGTSSGAMWTSTSMERSASRDSSPRRARREVTRSGDSATVRTWSTTNCGTTTPPGSSPARPSTSRNRSITAELSARSACPAGGAVCGARMRDKPAACTIWRPFTDPSRQPRVASTQATTAVMSKA